MNKFGSITAAELNEITTELKIEIKSLLCSSKQGLSEYELKKEYRTLFGKEIPFAHLGYNSVYELLRSMPDACYIMRHNSGNMWIYHGVIDETIKDLARLVRGQKTDKTAIRREIQRSQQLPRFNQYQTGYNQYSNGGYVNSSFRPPEMNFQPSVPATIQQQIQCILQSVQNNKLSLIDFDREYKSRYGSRFDSTQYGFNSMRQLFEHLSHIVYIETLNGRSDGSDLVCLKQANNQPKIVDKNVPNRNTPQNVTNVTIVNKIEEKKPPTAKEILTENITEIAKRFGSINVSDLAIKYEEIHKNSIDFEKFGFNTLDNMIYSLKFKNIIFKIEPPNFETKLVYGENSDRKKEIVNHSSDEDEIEDINKLKPSIRVAFVNQPCGRINEFFNIFERRNGWKLDFNRYGLKSDDQLLTKLVNSGLLKLEIDSNGDVCFDCRHLFDNYNENKTREIVQPQIDFNYLNRTEVQQRTKYISNFIQDYILYKRDLDNREVVKTFALKREHEVLISSVKNPCHIEVQLDANHLKLEQLMDKLEAKYNGFGASDFNMSDEYILTHRLCAATFSDNNWHRCRIVELNGDLVSVYYLDYGGEAQVPKDKIKFLYKEFDMPCQAVKAKFSNIKYNPKWDKDEESRKEIINYLLKRVMGKNLRAKIVGYNDGFLSLELIDNPKNECYIDLNKRIVMDGIGDFYDESKDIEFKDYETWKKEVLDEETTAEFKEEPKPKEDIVNKFGKALTTFETARSSVCSKTDLNNNEIKNDSDTKRQEKKMPSLKTKINIYYEPIHKKIYRLNIVKFNEVIYVHWSQVAILFGLSKKIFKCHLLQKLSETKKSDLYFKTFDFNDDTEELFDTVQNDFSIDLDAIDEASILFMLKFLRLYEIAADYLDEAYSNNLQQFIINNKVTGNQANPTLVAEYEKHITQEACHSEISATSSKVTSSIVSQMESLNLNDSQKIMFYINELSKLKKKLTFYEQEKEIDKIDRVKEKIKFCEVNLEALLEKKS